MLLNSNSAIPEDLDGSKTGLVIEFGRYATPLELEFFDLHPRLQGSRPHVGPTESTGSCSTPHNLTPASHFPKSLFR